MVIESDTSCLPFAPSVLFCGDLVQEADYYGVSVTSRDFWHNGYSAT